MKMSIHSTTLRTSLALRETQSGSADNLGKLTFQGLIGLRVLFVTPDHTFQHLRADLAPTLQGSAEPATRGPILSFRRRSVFVSGTRVPITIENVQRLAAVIEPIGPNRQINTINFDKPNFAVSIHGETASRKTHVGTMNFDEERSGAPGQPAKKINHPAMAVGRVPHRAAAFIITKERLRFRRDRHRFVAAFGSGPADGPARTCERRLVRGIPSLSAGVNQEKPNGKRCEKRQRQTRIRISIVDVRLCRSRVGLTSHDQAEQPKPEKTDQKNR